MIDKINKESLKSTTTQKNILVVDDDRFLIKYYSLILKEGYQITTALGGKAALECLANDGKKFDVILVDLNMPDINGVDLYNYIAKNNPGQQKQMIFVTGGAYTPLVEKFLENIDNIVLNKPVGAEALLGAITQVLRLGEIL